MKKSVSIFEKLLISVITFVFCVIILIQIFINNDVLDTIKANEQGTPVSYEDSINALTQGTIMIQSSDIKDTVILINGEALDSEDKGYSNPINVQVFEGDVIEIKNTHDEVLNINITNVSEEIDSSDIIDSVECPKGITYLFKIEMKKNVE